MTFLRHSVYISPKSIKPQVKLQGDLQTSLVGVQHYLSGFSIKMSEEVARVEIHYFGTILNKILYLCCHAVPFFVVLHTRLGPLGVWRTYYLRVRLGLKHG